MPVFFRCPNLRARSLAAAAGLVLLLTPGSTEAQRLLVRTYTVADGLASDRIMSLATDSDGFLWICTDAGVSRFDGSTFVTFRTDSGLPHHIVNHFLQTRAGTRWVGTNGGGVARLETGKASEDGRVFTAFPVGQTPLSMRVNVLLESGDGTLLAGTDDGLFRASMDGGDPDFELLPLASALEPSGRPQIWSMAEDPSGKLWIGTSAGLFGLDDRGGRRWHVPVSPLQNADHVHTLVIDRQGRLWLAHDRGLVIWSPTGLDAAESAAVELRPLLESAAPCAPADGEASAAALPAGAGEVCHWLPEGAHSAFWQRIRPELQTGDGFLWMTSPSGLAMFDGERFHVFAEPQVRPTYAPGTLAEDAAGDLWSASAHGLARIQRQGFVHYGGESGLANPVVRRVFEGPNDELLAVTATSHVHEFDGRRWLAARPSMPAEIGRGGRSIYGAVLVDHQGEWWVGSGDALFRFPRVASVEDLETTPPRARYSAADGLAEGPIRHLYEDSRGDLWIAGRFPGAYPLTRWHRRTEAFQRFGSTQGLADEDSVLAFAEDAADNLWLSVWGTGLVRFDGTRFHVLAPGRDLPPGRMGSSLHVDDRGGLWGTVGEVLIHIAEPTAADPRVSRYSLPPRPMPVGYLYVIADRSDWIYLSSARGLARLHPVSGGYHEVGRGMPFRDMTQGHRDPAGTLWFATTDGILRYEPQAPRESAPPPVWIGGVHVAGVPRATPPMGARDVPPMRLRRGERQIEIDYFGLGFGADYPLRFQHRFDGAGESWSDATTHRSVHYAGLGPGRYRFQVRAVSATGQLSPQPATVSFTIPLPAWRSPWTLTALAALLATLLIAAHRLRVRRLLELERVRTRIAGDLHDDLGASLARVSLLTEAARRKLVESPEAVARMLGEIGETSRELVAAAGDIAFAIDPGRGHLDGLLARLRRFAEDLVADTGIAWRLVVRGETAGVALSSEQRRHLLAILKEGLHNAIRHGRPRHVTLSFAVRGGRLEAELEDDGCGFPDGVPDAGNEALAGHGLRSMRQRAEDLGGRLRIESHPGTGTRITLHTPL